MSGIIMTCRHCGGTGTCEREYNKEDKREYSCQECRDVAHKKTRVYPGHYGKVTCSVCDGTGRIIAH